ncbi:FAD-dependent oxidoreductase [Wenzhouxiangella sp. AB-CW3]|uniref:NAD(P)/FAD-dependent oxidoreductase n=1 Tax=Wenzhouxiangella sp. AB-CW3 TaxID=2771012 RepID=UPI00168B2516|nr:FAD-dependent oxidoreductase [Wenzhouxiangella sp. AB-CW3]QOC23341.1 FAD-dependent oxidoreductase [Wenzhouxiangella sp. AB-CW3]
MKFVIVGAGIAGLYAAWHLSRRHEVIVLEAEERLGGHADTHRVVDEQGEHFIDSGFIVFNEQHYPLFSDWLRSLGVSSQKTDMSFGVSDPFRNLEYNATTLNGLFCQRRNLVSPRFYGMIADIVRFYRSAPALMNSLDDQTTLSQWLAGSGMGQMFADCHLMPMASALWSAPMGQIGAFPMRHLLAFMDNHAMLQLTGRPAWKTVTGGSRSYVEAATRCQARFQTGSPVRQVLREADRVRIRTDHGELSADGVILACHSDQALSVLADVSPTERAVLGAVAYQPNEAVLHTDVSVLPRRPRARAAWNVRLDSADDEQCRVTYYMNALQRIPSRRQYMVSLNQAERIAEESIIARRYYSHPVFTPAAVSAQERWACINGPRRTWFCGAWWGWGFHEDGARSARRVIDDIESRDE